MLVVEQQQRVSGQKHPPAAPDGQPRVDSRPQPSGEEGSLVKFKDVQRQIRAMLNI